MEVYRFTGSVRLAIQFVLSLAKHDCEYVHPDLTQAGWCNFDFFSEIRPGRIERLKRVERTALQTGYWEVARTIHFFLRGHLVADIIMVGQQVDRSWDCPRHSNWAVTSVHYARRFDRHEPEDWASVTWAPAGFITTDMDITS